METFKAIKERRTIRSFKNKNISDSDLRKILEAGNTAPCAGKLANWRFIVVRADKDKEKLSRACFNQEWVADAAVLIVVCSDSERIEELFGERGKMYAVQSTAAAIENMLIEATDLGIGSAWVGALDTDKVVNVLQIPDHIDIHAIVALGYADESPTVAKMKLPDVVFFDEWGKSEKGKSSKKRMGAWSLSSKNP